MNGIPQPKPIPFHLKIALRQQLLYLKHAGYISADRYRQEIDALGLWLRRDDPHGDRWI